MLSIRSRRRHTSPQKSPKKRSGARTFAIVALVLLVVFPLVALVGGLASRSQAQPQTPVTAQKSSESTPAPQPEKTVEDTFSSYNGALYDKSTNTYSFKYDDYQSLIGSDLSDSGSGLKSGTITRGGETWNVYCYQSSNSCSVSTSTGNYGNIYCHNSSNSCSYSDSQGNYANTYCYNYSNSCSTTHSDGSYSNTYCYSYSNNCTTNNSDGSTTNTYCYSYSSSCSSTTTGGSSSYSSYSSTYDY